MKVSPISEEVAADEFEVDNDCDILQAILNDGNYDILPEDQEALKSVIAALRTSYELETSNDEESDL